MCVQGGRRYTRPATTVGWRWRRSCWTPGPTSTLAALTMTRPYTTPPSTVTARSIVRHNPFPCNKPNTCWTSTYCDCGMLGNTSPSVVTVQYNVQLQYYACTCTAVAGAWRLPHHTYRCTGPLFIRRWELRCDLPTCVMADH